MQGETAAAPFCLQISGCTARESVVNYDRVSKQRHCCRRIDRKEETNMKIAIPCEQGEVMQHFGHATEFTVYTIEDIKPIEKETVTFDEVDHETVARGLKSRGVDLIICGEIGAGARSAVENAHMLLISGVTGEADEAVDSFLEGRLELMTGESDASAGGCGSCGGCSSCGSGCMPGLRDSASRAMRQHCSSTTALCTLSMGLTPQVNGPWPRTSTAGQ